MPVGPGGLVAGRPLTAHHGARAVRLVVVASLRLCVVGIFSRYGPGQIRSAMGCCQCWEPACYQVRLPSALFAIQRLGFGWLRIDPWMDGTMWVWLLVLVRGRRFAPRLLGRVLGAGLRAECDVRLVEWWVFLSVCVLYRGCSVEFGSLDCDHMTKRQLLFGQNFLKG